jgi:hypothetical protein
VLIGQRPKHAIRFHFLSRTNLVFDIKLNA